MPCTHLIVMVVFLLSLGLPAGHAAQTLLLDEIVIKGSGLPASAETLTLREVRESAARDLGEAVEKIPGLVGLRKGAIANDIVLRGLQRDNINVLMDGVRVQGGCPSRMDPPAFHFDFAEVDSVEVVKGPYDLRHAGSLGGLVNALSKSPDPGPALAATLTYGSYQQWHGSVTTSYASKQYDALAGYAYKTSLVPRSGNGKRLTEIYPASSSNRYRDDQINEKAYEIDTVWVKGGYQPRPGTRTELGFAYQDAQHILYPALLMDAEYDRTQRVNWVTTLEQPSARVRQTRLQVYWTRVEHLMHDEFRESSRPSMMVSRNSMMETKARTNLAGLNLTGTAEVGSGQLQAGLDGFYRNWNAVNRSAMYRNYLAQAMIPDVDQYQYGVFAEYNHPLGETVRIRGGLRLDAAIADAERLDSRRLSELYQPYRPGSSLDSRNHFFEPTGNLQWLWSPSPDLEIFAGLASASRMPDAQELYIGLERLPTPSANTPSWIGNPSLAPVRNNQADLGLRWNRAALSLNGALFYSRIDDYIALVAVADPDGPGVGTLPPARTYQNIDARIWGGELFAQLSLPRDLYLTTGLAYTEGKNRKTRQPLAEIPPLSGYVGLRYDKPTWFVELQERFAARQDRVDDNLNETKTSGWGVTDLKAGVQFDRWSVLAGVNNLFDSSYATHLAYQRDPFRSGVKVPEMGAFAYLTVMYRY